MSLVFPCHRRSVQSLVQEGALAPPPLLSFFLFSVNQSSVDDFVDCGLLVPGAGDDELIVGGNITAENR